MTTAQAVRRRRFNLSRSLLLIADHRCPCCEGVTAACEWPSWRRCEDCRCMWREDVIHGQRYACTVANPRCPTRSTDPEDR